MERPLLFPHIEDEVTMKNTIYCLILIHMGLALTACGGDGGGSPQSLNPCTQSAVNKVVADQVPAGPTTDAAKNPCSLQDLSLKLNGLAGTQIPGGGSNPVGVAGPNVIGNQFQGASNGGTPATGIQSLNSAIKSQSVQIQSALNDLRAQHPELYPEKGIQIESVDRSPSSSGPPVVVTVDGAHEAEDGTSNAAR
jgi:hypothetical protein